MTDLEGRIKRRLLAESEAFDTYEGESWYVPAISSSTGDDAMLYADTAARIAVLEVEDSVIDPLNTHPRIAIARPALVLHVDRDAIAAAFARAEEEK